MSTPRRLPEMAPKVAWTTSATLAPALAWGVYAFGPRALLVVAVAIASALASETAWLRLRGKRVTVRDGSAFLTGLLVGLALPASIPWYVPIVASVFATAIVKQFLGALGWNLWNPALAGLALVMAAWAPLVVASGAYPLPFAWQKQARAQGSPPAANARSVDAVTGATHLTKLRDRLAAFNAGDRGQLPAPKDSREAWDVLCQIREEGGTPLDDLYFGRRGGCIGEGSVCLLFLGGIVLVFLNCIKWQVPVLYIGTVALLGWALPIGVKGEAATFHLWFAGQPLAEVFAGGLFLAAFYMATDPVTSPVTARGQVLFAIGCGLLTVLIRRYGGYPEGVCYAVLLMTTATPLINRYTGARAPAASPEGATPSPNQP